MLLQRIFIIRNSTVSNNALNFYISLELYIFDTNLEEGKLFNLKNLKVEIFKEVGVNFFVEFENGAQKNELAHFFWENEFRFYALVEVIRVINKTSYNTV